MSFIWPKMLFALLLAPLLALLYLRMLRRRRQLAASYGSLELGQEGSRRQRRLRHHLRRSR